uniref:Uncharacterized protein n=1 Tax=Panagrolaimus davidi TaxID=227884 RepID=A0A914PYR9_9BILA
MVASIPSSVDVHDEDVIHKGGDQVAVLSDDRKDDDPKAENAIDKSKAVDTPSDAADEHILIAKNVENVEQSYVIEKETSDIIVVKNITGKNCDSVNETVVENKTFESKNVPQQLKTAPKRHISTNDEPVAPKKNICNR